MDYFNAEKEDVMKVKLFLVVLLLALTLSVVTVYADDGDLPAKLTLEDALRWVMSGGAGAVAFYLIEKVPALKKLAPDYKRYVSIGIVLVLVGLAWGAILLIGYSPMPHGWREWIEGWFSVSYIGLVTSLFLHGATSLKEKRKAMENASG